MTRSEARAGAHEGRDAASAIVSPSGPHAGGASRLRLRARVVWRVLTARFSSSLTRRIVVLNLGGLVVLVVGFLLLNQFRADIIEARVQSLTPRPTSSPRRSPPPRPSRPTRSPSIPDKLLQLAPGESAAPSPSDEDAIAVLDQSRAGRPGAAPARHADPYARPHLRQRRPAAARFARRSRPAAR